MAQPLIRSWTASSASRQLCRYALVLPASSRAFSVLNRPPPNYEGHVPLTKLERVGLAIGSALMSYRDPTRAGKKVFLSQALSTAPCLELKKSFPPL